ncbi:isocitrate lyase/PEP mutase family protein [Azospirillum halopraeferens]|uniref:isocitrate lyase/PEP mutase family protein n=1 Tax=Azospirillum halopraeferens TaxID=34010 RepID=UPI000418D2C9|nr:oxaloacetate decarboxylase [Azospirillum halopraeferens]
MKRTTRFRRLVEAPEILVLPGIQDALTARIAEAAGFGAITCGGYAATAALLGAPDTSQLGMMELADHYARITDAVDLPLFVDGDTGFGNTTNVARTIRAYERAGVAGLFIEDQVFPKRCGHMAGKAVVPPEEFAAKLKAALDARQDPDLVIMARTDALAVNGIDDAIDRGRLYREIGADMVFVEAPRDVEQMRRICREIDAPGMANNIEGGLTPVLTPAELQEIGYAVSVHPVATTYAITHAVTRLMRALAADGTTAAVRDAMVDFDTFNRFIGLPDQRAGEQRYADFARDVTAGK